MGSTLGAVGLNELFGGSLQYKQLPFHIVHHAVNCFRQVLVSDEVKNQQQRTKCEH